MLGATCFDPENEWARPLSLRRYRTIETVRHGSPRIGAYKKDRSRSASPPEHGRTLLTREQPRLAFSRANPAVARAVDTSPWAATSPTFRYSQLGLAAARRPPLAGSYGAANESVCPSDDRRIRPRFCPATGFRVWRAGVRARST